jgi:hypothetical protein
MSAKRLERYSRRVKENIWRGDHSSLIVALADRAETAEIARRLWFAIQKTTWRASRSTGDRIGSEALPSALASGNVACEGSS